MQYLVLALIAYALCRLAQLKTMALEGLMHTELPSQHLTMVSMLLLLTHIFTRRTWLR